MWESDLWLMLDVVYCAGMRKGKTRPHRLPKGACIYTYIHTYIHTYDTYQYMHRKEDDFKNSCRLVMQHSYRLPNLVIFLSFTHPQGLVCTLVQN